MGKALFAIGFAIAGLMGITVLYSAINSGFFITAPLPTVIGTIVVVGVAIYSYYRTGKKFLQNGK